eukprot:TRINITY_DN12317_c0_g1_i3.p6 TRINITY_DN12317_c0_g1~~TRINITY_DN12317_c0_g1_i3.p6  ORF type:complete len:114 (+),score=0.08 TRINITY_DN12317_c0_g1_i3:617-958(+)
MLVCAGGKRGTYQTDSHTHTQRERVCVALLLFLPFFLCLFCCDLFYGSFCFLQRSLPPPATTQHTHTHIHTHTHTEAAPCFLCLYADTLRRCKKSHTHTHTQMHPHRTCILRQ